MDKFIKILKSVGVVEGVLSTQLFTPEKDVNEFILLGHCEAMMAMMTFDPNKAIGIHAHEEIRVMVVCSGKMKLTLEDQVLEVDTGGVVSMLPHTDHRLEPIGPEPLRLMEMVIAPMKIVNSEQ